MKKLIAILLVLGLVAGYAFAQAELSVGGGAKATLLKGDSETDDIDVGFESWFWIGGAFTNDEGTAGAKGNISIDMYDTGAANAPGHLEAGTTMAGSADDTWFYAWWQPIDMLYLRIGKVSQDSKFWAGADIAAWGWQSNGFFINPGFNYYNGYAGNIMGEGIGFFDHGRSMYNGIQLSILPMDGFALNLGWSLANDSSEDALADAYGQIAVQAVYNIDGLGEAALGFTRAKVDGGREEFGWMPMEGSDLQFALQWKMGLGGGMKLEAGVRLDMLMGEVTDWGGNKSNETYLAPLQIGAGFGYGSPWGDTFWTSVRLAVEIPMEDGQATAIGLGICPSYDLGMFRVYFPIDFGIHIPDGGDAAFAWGVNPYIRKQMGGIDFWAGMYLHNGPRGGGTVIDTNNNGQINYAFQIGLEWTN